MEGSYRKAGEIPISSSDFKHGPTPRILTHTLPFPILLSKTREILLVFGVLAATIVLFVSEKLYLFHLNP